MKRRSFMAIISAVFAALTVKSERKKTPYVRAFWARNSKGKFVISKNQIMIFPEHHIARTGDCLNCSSISVVRVVQVSDIFGTIVYHCLPVTPFKKICGRSVIKVNGKYVQFKSSDREYEVEFVVWKSMYQEGGVWHAKT